jgi:hypothetical protein
MVAETPVAGPRTISWNDSNSFCAAWISAAVVALAPSVGWIFDIASATVTLCANAAAGRKTSSRTKNVRRMRAVLCGGNKVSWRDEKKLTGLKKHFEPLLSMRSSSACVHLISQKRFAVLDCVTHGEKNNSYLLYFSQLRKLLE